MLGLRRDVRVAQVLHLWLLVSNMMADWVLRSRTRPQCRVAHGQALGDVVDDPAQGAANHNPDLDAVTHAC